ncbi:uncharacterized protein BO96DRAFT_436872 [Aspergillus niger CBS 101883]|uniref:Uncharacterized protein n=2 Tax=Aspergillus niger TaxID=5061 RepID=A2QYB9_ASPNC|nr:uncharacterized protein BO96DRAFT_436872 [Aspergillus niger CBS 101883]XP_059601764.1 hypothetical protein An12g00695 [Aspergillus niger]PYH53577.1 hypothetical protein BO96DRAFT_436872 [Aspergillus niger CBS 101883]CAK40999.1 hypothetical protein An12g00695 [Aspergillus niger]
MQNRLTEHARTHTIIKKTVTRAQPHGVDNKKKHISSKSFGEPAKPKSNRTEHASNRNKIERQLRQTSRDCCLLLSLSR